MSKHYLFATLALAFSVSQGAMAIDRPTTPAGGPSNGEKYILVNAANPTGYMSRTAWDSALYFLGKSDSNYADYAFTAVKNEDNTWSFTYEGESTTYLGLPAASGNLNSLSDPVKWTVEAGNVSGFYYLTAGEGNSSVSQGLRLHLNAGYQYFVISEAVNGGGWYPDYAGGAIDVPADDETTPTDGRGHQAETEGGRAIMADNTSENWAFIKVDDVPEHMALYSVYTAINDFQTNYVDAELEDYAAGFKASFDAAVAIYEGSEFNWEDDADIITNMLSLKEQFYTQIESAKAIEDADAALTSAINNALSTFSTATTAAEIEGGIAALTTAVNAFREGNGDITGLGTNMSFEDLSSQDGNPTTGVQGAPTGWTVTINGTEVTTADEVRSAGIANWHGINADSNGDVKDGSYAFGIWTSGVPEYELSQTITGLENGTYLIDAGLMVGANGNGSRRTTQRIFGNLNSTYFASEAEYDLNLLDQSEVYDFANLTEPTTDTEMQPVQVRAYVYDGTLKFGLRTDGNYKAALRTTSNSAGGDGWFKTDNYRLTKVGYVGEDAAAVANHFVNALNNLSQETMQASLAEEVERITGDAAEITAETPADEINAAIVEYSQFVPVVQASIEAYSKLIEAIEAGYNNADEYQYYSGYYDYIGVVEEAQDHYDEADVDVEQINAIIDEINAALIDLQKSGMAVGDYLQIIQNPSFEDMSAQGGSESNGAVNPPAGWTLTLNGMECATSADYGKAGASMGWCAINNGDAIDVVDENQISWTHQYTDGTHLWGIWAGNMPEVELSQSFTGIPSGTYTLSCDMVVEWNWGGENTTTQRIFANDYIQMFGTEEDYAAGLNETEDMAIARALDARNVNADLKFLNFAGYKPVESYNASSAPKAMSLKFGVGDDGILKLGFRTNNVNLEGTAHAFDSSGWFKLDNFKLFWDSEDIPTAIKNATTGNAVQILGQKYYTADGRQISAPGKGITIVKNIMSDGSVKTVKIIK